MTINNNNNDYDDKILDYVLGKLPGHESIAFENRLAQDKRLQQEVEETRGSLALFKSIDDIAVPTTSQAMDDGFYNSLNQAQKQQLSSWDKLRNWTSNLFTFETLKPVLYGAAMLTVGVFIGNNYKDNNNIKTEINNRYANIQNKDYADNMQKLAVVSLLQLPSVSSRLQAVSLVENSDQKVGDVVINALFETLNNDTNINVRLAVLNTLAAYSNTADVRAGLVDSILFQDSPMVQVAISELMLNLQETKAIEPLQQLLNDENTINTAKERITLALNQLI